MNNKGYSETFLKANASEQFIAQELTCFIQNILRDTISFPSSGKKYDAANNFINAIELIGYAGELNFTKLIKYIISNLRIPESINGREDTINTVMQNGISLFLEKTSKDGFAKARASKIETNLLLSIKDLQAE